MNISILGSGVYAKAISNVLMASGSKVTMWTEKEDFKTVLAKEGINLTNSFEEAASTKDIIFVLTGSKFVRTVLEGIAPFVYPDTLIVLGSKGILDDGTMMIDLAQTILSKNRYAVISGPTFATDIAALEPVGFTIAASSKEDFKKLQNCLKTAHLEYSEDILAIEMCGSLKNAYAIGSGILAGADYSTSTSCLYITKVLAEMGKIFTAMGAHKEAVNTLAGVGDLVLTCMSPNSRNYTFGTILALGSKKQIDEYLQKNTVEGYENLKAYVGLFAHQNITAPILNLVLDVVEGKKTAKDLTELLLMD